MNPSRALLGIYVPGTSMWHRAHLGWKYVAFLLVTLPAVFGPSPVVIAALLISLALVATTKAPLRLAWGLPTGLVVLFAVVGGYHIVLGNPVAGIRVVGATLTALYASRLLLLTTPVPVLVDALASAVRPLRPSGARPERFGLAIAILLRSIPAVLASFTDVRDAQRARGIQRNPFSALTPVIITAVAQARMTGEALTARGLGDDD